MIHSASTVCSYVTIKHPNLGQVILILLMLILKEVLAFNAYFDLNFNLIALNFKHFNVLKRIVFFVASD